jgi:hypothetical protein
MSDELPSVTIFFNEWMTCLSVRNQAHNVYRHGKFDTCKHAWNDFKIAMRSKVSKSPEKAKQLLESTELMRRNKVSPTVGVIWELKETPSWETTTRNYNMDAQAHVDGSTHNTKNKAISR